MSRSTLGSGDPNDYFNWRVAIAGVILLILIAAVVWMMFDAGKTNNPDGLRPTGRIVRSITA